MWRKKEESKNKDESWTSNASVSTSSIKISFEN